MKYFFTMEIFVRISIFSFSDEEFKSFKGDKSKATVRRASDEEIAKLSGMSSDERLKYFKEKYAKQGSAVFDGKNRGKNKEKPGRGKIPSPAKKSEKVPKKLGLIARLKSLIGRGK